MRLNEKWTDDCDENDDDNENSDIMMMNKLSACVYVCACVIS